MYQTGNTIEGILDQIAHHDLVLPAIQREFVWDRNQICRLFDSLMQGYPFGTFLFWRVAPWNSDKFRFFDFVREYHQRDNPHCPRLGRIHDARVTAVLDGQQRLTALNIGLKGSGAWKEPRKWWSSPDAFPTRHLYLDLLWDTEGGVDEEDIKYRFMFRRESDPCHTAGECWFPASEILGMDKASGMRKWVRKYVDGDVAADAAFDTLYRLYQVIRKDHVIAYYEEKRQELDEVVQIFIRMNDGGTPLSHSDLLLSIAVAQWIKYDARKEIHDLVDNLNDFGQFWFSKDLVLKAGLMLSDIGSVGFKVDNFNRQNMERLETQWPAVKETLKLTIRLVAQFGFTHATLTAHNALLPIAYYLHRSKRKDSFLDSEHFIEDREVIREWLARSLLKRGVWGSGLDTLLTALRRVIRESDCSRFPVETVQEEMARRGRPLVFEAEEIEELADTGCRQAGVFALLSILFPFIDPRDQFHVDHIFPSSRFTTPQLRAAKVPAEQWDSFKQTANRLANLQLLRGRENLEKRAMMPAEWLRKRYPEKRDRRVHREDHLIGPVPETLGDFGDFYKDRRRRLRQRIADLLGNPSGFGIHPTASQAISAGHARNDETGS